MCSPSLQVENTITKELFLHEAHIHALAHWRAQTVIVVQPSSDQVTLTEYQPGWKAPGNLTRQEMIKLHADKMHPPLLIHLDQPPTHFSALLPAHVATRPSKRKHLRSVGNSQAAPIVM